MQTIAHKLTVVSKSPAAAGWSENELRALIHGTGGSPRRAKRLLKADPEQAKTLADAFAADIAAGTAFVNAVKAAAERFAAIAAEESEEESEAA